MSFSYRIFEKLRSTSTRQNGGGLSICCKPEHNSIWGREGREDVETLSVNIFIENQMLYWIFLDLGVGKGNSKREKKHLVIIWIQKL